VVLVEIAKNLSHHQRESGFSKCITEEGMVQGLAVGGEALYAMHFHIGFPLLLSGWLSHLSHL
jgi:hypothetical protein